MRIKEFIIFFGNESGVNDQKISALKTVSKICDGQSVKF